jgi:aspartokinase/homoserine dehydrogenase 2
VPAQAQTLYKQAFLASATCLDELFADAFVKAKAKGECLRYVARLIVSREKITAKVGLESLPFNDPFASLTPCDNIFLLRSNWNQENPLIIRGPGAGRDVTAGGLHSDLVNLCQKLAKAVHYVDIEPL